jgi:hypothetical protein
MAGLAPFFITGANAKIKMNGITLAFCTNLSYSITVNHATPTLLGMYEPASIEPLSYKVAGTVSVVRYANNVKGQLEQLGYKTPHSVSPDGNGIGSVTPNAGFGDKLLRAINPLSSDGRSDEAFDPSKLQNGTFFDIEVYQKMPDGNHRGVAKIRSCRLTRSDVGINKKSPTQQTFQFTALYVDEDSFNADFSGTGQQFA